MGIFKNKSWPDPMMLFFINGSIGNINSINRRSHSYGPRHLDIRVCNVIEFVQSIFRQVAILCDAGGGGSDRERSPRDNSKTFDFEFHSSIISGIGSIVLSMLAMQRNHRLISIPTAECFSNLGPYGYK